MPGYFFVSYVYDFWNPVGENWQYVTSGPQKLSEVYKVENTTVVLMAEDPATKLGPGTILVWDG